MKTPSYTIELIDRLENARSVEAVAVAYASIVDYAFNGVAPDEQDFAAWVELTRAQNEREATLVEGEHRVMYPLLPVAGYVLADGRPDVWADVAFETAQIT